MIDEQHSIFKVVEVEIQEHYIQRLVSSLKNC